MMRVLIAEDDAIYASLLEMMFLEMQYDAVEIISNSEAIFERLPTFQPDLMLLDIHLEGELDGIQLAEKVQEILPYMPVIFMTSYQDDEVYERAKRIKPYAFLTKPFDEKLLMRTIELAFQHYNTRAIMQDDIQMPDSIFVKTENILKKIHFAEIGYIEAQDKYLDIATPHRKYLVRYTMHEIMEKLPHSLFVQVSRSFIVNRQHITEIDLEDNCFTIFQQKIPFSKRNRQEILAMFK